ncbi:MAG: pilus assembly protein PilM [bacterium]|nr:pilus assembly protein PilM [bacterium]
MAIFKKLTGLFSSGGESVLGIDVGSSAIKIVQLKKKGGRAILETYGELALGPYAGHEVGRAASLPDVRLSEALIDVLRESHVTTKKCGIAIPLRSSLLSIMPMPDLPEDKLASMIPIEARKYIPVPISEVMLDWSVIPENSAGNSPPPGSFQGQSDTSVKPAGGTPFKTVEILIAAIHNDAMNKYQYISKNAGLEVSFYEIEIWSTLRSSLDNEKEPVLIFDMGAAATKLYIIEQGIVRNSHTVNRGSQEITMAISRSLNISAKEAEVLKREKGLGSIQDSRAAAGLIAGTVQYIFAEANRVISNYERKYNKAVGKVVLSGGGVNLKNFEKLAAEKTKLPVLRADPFSKVEAPAFFEDMLKGAGPEFAVSLGVALRKLQETQ